MLLSVLLRCLCNKWKINVLLSTSVSNIRSISVSCIIIASGQLQPHAVEGQRVTPRWQPGVKGRPPGCHQGDRTPNNGLTCLLLSITLYNTLAFEENNIWHKAIETMFANKVDSALRTNHQAARNNKVITSILSRWLMPRWGQRRLLSNCLCLPWSLYWSAVWFHEEVPWWICVKQQPHVIHNIQHFVYRDVHSTFAAENVWQTCWGYF